jgi:hypothetical protein
MDFFDVLLLVAPELARLVPTEFHLRAPEILKNWKSGFPPRDAVLEIGPEWRRFYRHGNRDAEAETARETENLVAWGGESGRSPARGEGDSRASGGGRISGFQIFRERTLRFSGQGSLNDP